MYLRRYISSALHMLSGKEMITFDESIDFTASKTYLIQRPIGQSKLLGRRTMNLYQVIQDWMNTGI